MAFLEQFPYSTISPLVFVILFCAKQAVSLSGSTSTGVEFVVMSEPTGSAGRKLLHRDETSHEYAIEILLQVNKCVKIISLF